LKEDYELLSMKVEKPLTFRPSAWRLTTGSLAPDLVSLPPLTAVTCGVNHHVKMDIEPRDMAMSFLLNALPIIKKSGKSHRGIYLKGSGRSPFSDSDQYGPPPELFQAWDGIFNFTLDVCANPRNHKTRHYYTKKTDGLTQPWAPQQCWMNPPYSRIYPWCRKAFEEAQNGATVVGLLPVWNCYPCGPVSFGTTSSSKITLKSFFSTAESSSSGQMELVTIR
jgi:hypothetical protein